VTSNGTGRTVCVAIPVKNGADYLVEALESVLAQDGVDLSVRIRDNLSVDDSVAVAESYAARDPRVSVAVNEQDVMYYGSLNRILAETDAKWFVPFAHDDVMQPGNLAKKVAALERADARFAHSSALNIDEGGTVTGVAPDHSGAPEVMDAPAFFSRIAPLNIVAAQSVVVGTGALRAIGGYDARSLYAGDWLTWMRLALRERVVTLAEPLIANRVHSAAGTAASNRAGFNGRDIPATLDRVFLDPAMPEEWKGMRGAMVAATSASVARVLHDDGIRRVDQGWAGYMTAGRGLARRPDDPALRELYRVLVQASDLAPPRVPFDAVAAAPADAADAERLSAVVEEVGPLFASLVIAVEPGRVDEAMTVLEPLFGDTELDVAVVPTDRLGDLFVPGRLVLAPWGSDRVAAAEDAGLPVYPYGMPDPFGRAPDPVRWETVDPTVCLP
jgi:hypothetical protein